MPRTKEFDEAEVLDQALELFRARGFKHTSFADLTEELGVSRQSLYDTYGDKQTLYHTALKRYGARSLDHMRRLFSTPGPIRPLLELLFQRAIEGSCQDGHHGCLMANSMVELAPHDDAIRAMAIAHAREIEGLLAARLSIAQRAGDIPLHKDPITIARYLYHTLLGFAVAARALGEHDSLRASAQLALQVLD